MKQKIISFFKKQWLILWIFLMLTSLVTLFASAEAMVTLSPMKRVLVSKDGHGLLFSSSILDKLVENEPLYLPIYKAAGTGTYNVDLYLWNYDIHDEGTRYPEDINYRLTAVMTDSEGREITAEKMGSRSVIITPTSPTGTALKLNADNLSGELTAQRLAHSDASSTENAYTITYSAGWDLEKDTDICVKILAIPTAKNGGEAYSDLKTIGKIVGLRQSRVTGSNGWDAVINEQSDTNSPTDFDAYNLTISGSGSAEITVSWDTTKLDVNKNFYTSASNVYGFNFSENEIVDNGVANGWHTITINADTGKASQKNRNRYILQLYKIGELSDSTSPANWGFFAKNLSAQDSANAWIRVTIQ